MKILPYKDQNGFTLVEILLSMAIFSLLVFAVTTIYLAFNSSQIRTSASQQLLNDSQYAMEIMAREIRANKIVNYSPDPTWCNDVIHTWVGDPIFDSCIVLERPNGQVFALTTRKQSVSSPYTDLWYVSLNNCGDDYLSCDNWKNDYGASTKILATVLNNIDVEELDFDISPDSDPFVDGGTNKHPKVTIKMTASYYSDNAMQNVSHTFQTTVSSRVYKR